MCNSVIRVTGELNELIGNPQLDVATAGVSAGGKGVPGGGAAGAATPLWLVAASAAREVPAIPGASIGSSDDGGFHWQFHRNASHRHLGMSLNFK